MKKILSLSVSLVIVAALLAGCAAGPKTPQEAFEKAQQAYINKNYNAYYDLLSKNAKETVKKTVESFKKMPEPQLQFMASMYGVKVEDLKKMTPTGFIKMSVQMTEKLKADPKFKEMSKGKAMDIADMKIKDIIEKGNEATITFMNFDFPLYLTKEGGSWKIDIKNNSQGKKPAKAPAPAKMKEPAKVK